MPVIPWYFVPEGDECLIITGGRAVKAPKGGGEAPEFRIVKGRGVWVSPFRKARRFRFTLMDTDVVERCPTNQGITINVQAVINFRLDRDVDSLYNSVPMFLRDNGEMLEAQAQKIFAGHLRSIVGTMTIDQIIGERQQLANEVLDASKTEMLRLGIVVESFQIQQFDDGGSDYIKYKAAPHIAGVQRDAAIAQAQATQQAAEAEQKSQQAILAAQKATALIAAANKAETDKAEALAAQAGPLQQADSQQAVIDKQAALAERNAELRQQQLVAEVIRPAEAQKQAIVIDAEARKAQTVANAEASKQQAVLNAQAQAEVAAQNAIAAGKQAEATIAQGDAEAHRTRVTKLAEAEGNQALAEAAAAGDRASLDKLSIEQMPAIFANLAAMYDGAQMTFYDGIEAPVRNMAGLGNQVMTMFNAFRAQMKEQERPEDAVNGQIDLAGVGVKK